MSHKPSHKQDPESSDKSAFKVESLLQKTWILDEISEILPGTLHINSLDDFSLLYFDKSGEEVYKCSFEEVRSKGFAIMDEVIHVGDTMAIIPQMQKFVEENDHNANLSFFQRLKGIGEKKYKWYYTNCKLSDIGLISISYQVKDLKKHKVLIEKILDENAFFKENFQKFQLLTKREKEVLKELALGKTAPQISEEFCISINTVKTHRQRIFEKLEARTITELYKYAFHFDLI